MRFFKTHRRTVVTALVIICFLALDYLFDRATEPIVHSEEIAAGEEPPYGEPQPVALSLQIAFLAIFVFSRPLWLKTCAGGSAAVLTILLPWQGTITCAFFLALFYLIKYVMSRRHAARQYGDL